MSDALALLEKYAPKVHSIPCPDDLKGLLKELSDYAMNGRKLSREALLDELKKRGHNIGRKTLAGWVKEAGGQPWFSTR